MNMRIWNDLLNLFFPSLCLICDEPLVKGEQHICSQCLCKLPKTNYHNSVQANPAEQLFVGMFAFEHATAFLQYEKEGSVQTLIHSLKYKGNKELGYYLGRLAALDLLNIPAYQDIDLLVPIPLHPHRQKARGYNQAEWIARGIASVLNKPIDTTSLRRIKMTQTQTRKSVYDRRISVHNVFEMRTEQPFTGKHLLLIDDVMTTGSTIGAAAAVIVSIPEARISILSLAIA